MTDLPEPLTPPECDLQDFPFMPLQVARLRDSDLAAEEDPEACWFAVLLWAASWHQIPAGSLPDNDNVLMRLIGLGRDSRTWKKRKAGALRGFAKCSDGRLYHPVVAEQALSAWNSKLQQRWRTECARIKKHNQRHNSAIPYPTFEDFAEGQCEPVPLPVPNLSPGTLPNCPEGKPIQGTGIGTETGNNIDVGDSASARVGPDDWPGDLIGITDEIARMAGVRHIDPAQVLRNQETVNRWLTDGFDPETEIAPVIRQGLVNTDQRISSLAFFDAPIRQSKARKEAAANGYQPSNRDAEQGPGNPMVRAVAARRASRADAGR